MAADRLYQMFPALRHPAFFCYIIGQTISLFGQWMKRLAMSWLVFRLTESAFLLGIVEFVSLAPILFLGLFAGAWLERHDLRKALVVTQILCMSVGAALTFVTFTGQASYTLLVGLSLILGLVGAFDMTARQSSVSLMVSDPMAVKSAVALNSMAFNISKLAGPSLAGLIIWLWGEGICFLISTLAYLPIIGMLIFRIRLRERSTDRKRRGMLADMAEGLRYVRGEFFLNRVFRLFSAFCLLSLCYAVLFPMFASHVLEGGSKTLGWLFGVVGAGSFFGGVTVSILVPLRRIPATIAASTLLSALSLLVFSFSTVLWISLAAAFTLGFGLATNAVSINTMLQTTSSDSCRSRVMSLYVMCTAGLGPVGGLFFGAIADWAGAPATMTGCAIAILVFIGMYLKDLKKLCSSLDVRLNDICAADEHECPEPVNFTSGHTSAVRSAGIDSNKD